MFKFKNRALTKIKKEYPFEKLPIAMKVRWKEKMGQQMQLKSQWQKQDCT